MKAMELYHGLRKRDGVCVLKQEDMLLLLSTFRDYTPMTNCPIGIGNKEAERKLYV